MNKMTRHDDEANENETEVHEGEGDLPFGAEHVEDLSLPFCACGRFLSQCDGSRRGCAEVGHVVR